MSNEDTHIPAATPATYQALATTNLSNHALHGSANMLLSRQIGLTKTCNLFHNPEYTAADLARLHELPAAMDRAILSRYGWGDFDPAHGSRQNERGQTRYTISPAARRGVLHKLL